MLTPEERNRIAREHYLTDYYDPDDGPPVAGRLPMLAARFPVPNTDGMSPDQREATLAAWRTALADFVAKADAAGQRPAPTPVPVRESA